MKVILKNTKLVFSTNTPVEFIAGRYLSLGMLWVTNNTGYSSSNIYEVQVGTKIKIKNFSTGSGCYMIHAYTAGGTIVSTHCYGKDLTQPRDEWYEETINDASVKYVVLNTRNENFTTPNEGYEAIITDYVDITEPQL